MTNSHKLLKKFPSVRLNGLTTFDLKGFRSRGFTMWKYTRPR